MVGNATIPRIKERGSDAVDGLDVLLLRRKAGVRQWQLAAKLGYSPSYMCDIENGRAQVTPEMLERVEGALSEMVGGVPA